MVFIMIFFGWISLALATLLLHHRAMMFEKIIGIPTAIMLFLLALIMASAADELFTYALGTILTIGSGVLFLYDVWLMSHATQSLPRRPSS